MKIIIKAILLSVLVLVVSGCYPVETMNSFSDDISFAESESKPVYLSFRDNKKASYYFLLSKDSENPNYRITVRWKNPKKSQLLFDGLRTTMKFLVNREKIYRFHPIKNTRVIAYNMNTRGQEEEGVFELPEEVFREIAYAKAVQVELSGRKKTVIGEFNRLNTMKAFRNFYEESL